MADAATFIAKVQREVRPLDQQITDHPFLETVTSGRATIEGLRAMPGHQFHITESLIRSGERLVERFGDTASGPYFRRALADKRQAARELLDFARALGMSKSDLQNYEPLPGGFSYAAYCAWLAEQGSAAESALVAHVNLPVWGEACRRVSEGLQEFYGLGPTDTRVLDRFAMNPTREQFEAVAEIVQDALDQGVPAADLARAARLVQGYEKEFWDTMSKVDADYRAWPPVFHPIGARASHAA